MPQQQQCVPSEATHEHKLVDLHGVGGEGTGKKQLLQRQQLPRSHRLQAEQQSEDCCACNEELELPPKQPSSSPPPPPPPSWSRPLSSPPSPPLPSPPLFLPLLPPHLQACSRARPLPESMANLLCTTRKEKMRDGITWPAGAGRKVEEIATMEHACEYWNEIKKAVAGTGGRICTMGWGSEHARKKEERPKAGAGKGEKNNGPSARSLGPHQAHFDFVAFACC